MNFVCHRPDGSDLGVENQFASFLEARTQYVDAKGRLLAFRSRANQRTSDYGDVITMIGKLLTALESVVPLGG